MVNDISIITGIIASFILIGILLPFLNEGFSTSVTTNNVGDFENQIGDTIKDVRSNESVTGILGTFSAGAQGVGFLKVFFSVVSMFFWTFGALPFWLDGIFLILRLMLVMIIARNIWIGGGG